MIDRFQEELAEQEKIAEIRNALATVGVDSYLKHKKKLRHKASASISVLVLLVGALTISPFSKAPTLSQAWSAEPQNIDSASQQVAESKCRNAISELKEPELNTFTDSLVLDYRSGIGFLRLNFSDHYWNCGFSTASDSVSVTPWSPEIGAPGMMVKTYGHIDPNFVLNISSKPFDTGSSQFPKASFITGTTSEKTATVKVNVAGLPEGTATLRNGIYGIWIPAVGEAKIQFFASDGSPLDVLTVKSVE